MRRWCVSMNVVSCKTCERAAIHCPLDDDRDTCQFAADYFVPYGSQKRRKKDVRTADDCQKYLHAASSLVRHTRTRAHT